MTAPQGTYTFDESELIQPSDPIPEGRPLFVINASRSNKKLEFKDERVMLTAPGTPQSIQMISQDMLRSAGFLSLWSAGEVQVSTSDRAQRMAVSEAVERAQASRTRMEGLNTIAQAAPVSGNSVDDSKVEDVSYRFREIVDNPNRGKRVRGLDTVSESDTL